MNIHPVFYVILLEQYWQSTDPTPKQEPPLPDEVDDSPSFVIEEIVDSCWYGQGRSTRVIRYMVVLAGYGPEGNN